MALAVLAAAVAGCARSPTQSSISPVAWWHALEGGRIAEARPPPPNDDAPYPTLGTVPKRPAPPDAALHARVAGGLVADRGNAHYAASQAPIGTLPPASARPPRVVATDDDQQSNASLPAASARPAPQPAAQAPLPSAPASPATPIARSAPVGTVAAAPLPSPAPAPAAMATAPMGIAPVTTAPVAAADPVSAADAAALSMPDAPPPSPRIAGISVPAMTAPTPPPLPPPPAVVEPKLDGPSVAIPFALGSAVMTADALPPIKQLAGKRGAASIAVTGFGEATSTEPAAQSAALPLAFDRARAVAARLVEAGVPSAAIRLAAEPQGNGAAARLIN